MVVSVVWKRGKAPTMGPTDRVREQPVKGSRALRTGPLLVYAGLAVALAGALAGPWVNVTWSRFILRLEFRFGLSDNSWLMAVALIILVLTLFLMHFRVLRGWGALGGGLACLAVVAIYAYALAAKAYGLLGILHDLTRELTSHGIPFVGEAIEEFVLGGISSVTPAAGFLLFCGGTALIVAGGILEVRRFKRAMRQG
jgi:hypothetical protein